MKQGTNQDATKSGVPLQRWYDQDTQLGELVHTLETLSPKCQKLFAYLLQDTCNRIIKLRGRDFVRQLDWTIFIGLIKSRRGRRWYDQEATLRVAFKTLYSLSFPDKALVGRELSIPAQLVQRYETYCQKNQDEISLDMVQTIVETCIKEGPKSAQDIYSIFQ